MKDNQKTKAACYGRRGGEADEVGDFCIWNDLFCAWNGCPKTADTPCAEHLLERSGFMGCEEHLKVPQGVSKQLYDSAVKSTEARIACLLARLALLISSIGLLISAIIARISA